MARESKDDQKMRQKNNMAHFVESNSWNTILKTERHSKGQNG